MADRVAWVSGASSGLGKAAAAALKHAGWQVVAGARSFTDREGEADWGFQLALDVREEASVQAFCERAVSLFGLPQALVNAAGILIMGPAEETSIKEYEAVMDTILMGTIRLTQAALPLMRRQGNGKIVMISSVNGLMPTPFQSAYVAAKHALEGYSECLMLETRSQGIQVMLVEPGDHSGGSASYRAASFQVSLLYQDSFERVRSIVHQDESQGGAPEQFGRRLAKVMDRKRLPTRLKVTAVKEDAAIILHDVLPGKMFHKFLGDYYKV